MTGGKHEQTNPPPAGETWVDTSTDEMRRAGNTPDQDETVAPVPNKPTKHDGTQTKR